MSDDRHDIILKPEDDDDSPDILGRLADEIHNLFPVAGEAGGKWLRGKGEQEFARAAEIRARVVTMLGELYIERDRLIQERENAKEAARQSKTHESHRHKERLIELDTQRIGKVADVLLKKAEALNKAVSALKLLRELGVEVDIETVRRLLPS